VISEQTFPFSRPSYVAALFTGKAPRYCHRSKGQIVALRPIRKTPPDLSWNREGPRDTPGAHVSGVSFPPALAGALQLELLRKPLPGLESCCIHGCGGGAAYASDYDYLPAPPKVGLPSLQDQNGWAGAVHGRATQWTTPATEEGRPPRGIGGRPQPPPRLIATHARFAFPP